LLNVQNAINNIELIIHIYECIMHMAEKMDIDLGLYRGPKYDKQYKLFKQIDLKRIKRRKRSKEENARILQTIFLNENIKRINKLKNERQRLQNIKREDFER